MKERSSGILMHISSLPSDFGIGSLGEEAYKFVDFLVEAKQSYWQILPLGHTSYGDSPYQCFSAFAGNPYFIDLEILKEEGLLEVSDYANESFGEFINKVDYEKIFNIKRVILKKAYEKFKSLKCMEEDSYKIFKIKNEFWLNDYSEYMAIKESFNLKPWFKWDHDIRNREEASLNKYRKVFSDEIEYYKFIQYKFFIQWEKLKKYANSREVKIIGDLPIYVAGDSTEMWCNKELFKVNENGEMSVVAGCPPDAFAITGQLWGNPIYNWDEMEKNDYSWWIKRIEESLKLYDMIRIDHFRGFEAYWQIPYGDKTAENGVWMKGPGIKLFNKVKEKLGEVNIIAEDLGFMTDEVIKFRDETGFPGMKVLQFGFGCNDSRDLPHNYIQNSVAYLGTHDNTTITGWINSVANGYELEQAKKYMNTEYLYSDVFIKEIWKSVSFLAIVTMQDLLYLGDEARMNTPSVLGGNWQWRIKKEEINKEIINKLREITILYGRNK